MRRLAAFFVILLGVSACESTAENVALAVLGANMTSTIYTDRTLLDHGVGASIGQDCSLLNIEKRKPYCQERSGQYELRCCETSVFALKWASQFERRIRMRDCANV